MAHSVSLTTTNRSLLSIFVRRLRLLQSLFNLPNTWIIQTIKNLLSRLLSNPHVAELLRFLFLGTVVEVSKVIGQKALDSARHFFIVKASFKRDDFAFDWVKLYLEDLKVWDQSRVFRVSACNPLLLGNTSGHGLGEEKPNDGRPKPVYQPAPSEPELFRWRDYWITVNMDLDSEKDRESVQILTLSVWSRNRKILDDFVQAARTHFLNSSVPPRILRLPETVRCSNILLDDYDLSLMRNL
ncbi:hypothetical protein DFH11DRAFT_589794 [Phellopilus nigrolimitatus]|nr:hypothetical protein DFH11DRAFT_589794 [Phellopilus nigrolimitatus]